MSKLRISATFLAGVMMALCLLPGSAGAQLFPAAPGDDTTASLGQAIIWVSPPFRNLVSALPGWNSPHWTTPVMFDGNTIIGRSAVHLDADPNDLGGTPVGTAGTIVADANFAIVPVNNFTEGPPGTRELHTEIYSLIMTDFSLGLTVRGGTGAGVALPSFGEVEAKGTNDFPAESFFNIFIEMDTPFYGGTTLFNLTPMLVVNPDLMALPPTVVYIHEETTAVAVFFRDGPSAGSLFGYLRLAGHRTGVDPVACAPPPGGSINCAEAYELMEVLEAHPLMKCRQCRQATDIEPTDIEPTEIEPVPVGGIH